MRELRLRIALQARWRRRRRISIRYGPGVHEKIVAELGARRGKSG
jgi:hypothetical protein